MSSESPTIVLIHGMWMTPRSWDSWVDHYADRGHRAIAPAWPGVKDPRRDAA
jgi:non-heme chloroperoxidase